MPELDQSWTTSAAVEDAATYSLEARDTPYLVSVDGRFLKVKVGKGHVERPEPIIVEADMAAFRQAAARPKRHG